MALDYVQKTTLGNKAMLEENDPAVRKARQDDLSATAADPEKAREFLLRSSMMASLDSEATGE
jgi:3-(3-hydroxy-phenyl)propionate hydroxylase